MVIQCLPAKLLLFLPKTHTHARHQHALLHHVHACARTHARTHTHTHTCTHMRTHTRTRKAVRCLESDPILLTFSWCTAPPRTPPSCAPPWCSAWRFEGTARCRCQAGRLTSIWIYALPPPCSLALSLTLALTSCLAVVLFLSFGPRAPMSARSWL